MGNCMSENEPTRMTVRHYPLSGDRIEYIEGNKIIFGRDDITVNLRYLKYHDRLIHIPFVNTRNGAHLDEVMQELKVAIGGNQGLCLVDIKFEIIVNSFRHNIDNCVILASCCYGYICYDLNYVNLDSTLLSKSLREIRIPNHQRPCPFLKGGIQFMLLECFRN